MPDKRIAVSVAAVLCTLSGACADGGIYIMSERYEISGDAQIYAGGGCALAIPSRKGSGTVSAGGGSAEGDFSYSEMRVGSSYVVVVRSQGQELTRREYDEDELLSGERDQFTVTTLSGRVYQLTYWGGTECEAPDL